MQPYLFPYIGYFQLIKYVDVFVVYDNIKYTKKGWINRNHMLVNGKSVVFSLPIKKDSDHLNVCERELATNFNRDKLLNQFTGAYLRAPFFKQTLGLVENILRHEDRNLFRFLHYSISKTCEHLGIETEIRVSSGITIDHKMMNQEKVLAICEALGASTYVNPIGGKELYSKEKFREKGISLKFIQLKPIEYAQFGDAFVPSLSIIDVMMFNPLDKIRTCIATNYEVI
jgi:hypothetical protein